MLASSDIGTTNTNKSVDHNLHTVKITGHLTFDSKYQHFQTAFKEFIQKEGLQLQVTDMQNPDLPSMEIGVRLSLSADFANFSDQRYADNIPLTVKPKTAPITVEKVVEIPAKKIKKTKIGPVDPQTGSDLAFY